MGQVGPERQKPNIMSWFGKRAEKKVAGSDGKPNAPKGQMTEREAVIRVNQHMINSAIQVWPGLCKNIEAIAGFPLHVADEEQVVFDLSLAAIALDLQAVRNLYPKTQAERIDAWAYKLAYSARFGDYAFKELRRYSEAFQSELQLVGNDGNPLGVVSGLLLHRWLGDELKTHEVVFQGKKTGLLNPLLLAAVNEALCAPPFVGTWKYVKDNFVLVEG